MKTIITCISLIGLFAFGCDAQTQKSETDKTQRHQPHSDIRVNKEYDEQGNLIRYDSSYTSYYSNIEGDTIMADSILNVFKNQFNTFYPFSHRPFFHDFFFEDSLLQYDFYKEDFFMQRFRKNMEQMDRMFWEMDSMKNHFFKGQFPKGKSL